MSGWRQDIDFHINSIGNNSNIKADLEATRKRVSKKDERINELEDKLERKPTLPDNAEADKYALDLHHEAVAVVSRIQAGIRARSLAVLDSHGAELTSHGELLVAQALGQIISAARAVGTALEIAPAANPASVYDRATPPGQIATDLLNAELDAEAAGE